VCARCTAAPAGDLIPAAYVSRLCGSGGAAHRGPTREPRARPGTCLAAERNPSRQEFVMFKSSTWRRTCEPVPLCCAAISGPIHHPWLPGRIRALLHRQAERHGNARRKPDASRCAAAHRQNARKAKAPSKRCLAIGSRFPPSVRQHTDARALRAHHCAPSKRTIDEKHTCHSP
jgi:hypothetical protein